MEDDAHDTGLVFEQVPVPTNTERRAMAPGAKNGIEPCRLCGGSLLIRDKGSICLTCGSLSGVAAYRNRRGNN